MGLWDIFTGQLQNNIGMAMPQVILLIMVLGSLILMAVHFQVGTILSLLISAGMYMLFNNFGISYAPFLVCTFMYLIILTLSLWSTIRISQEGGIV